MLNITQNKLEKLTWAYNRRYFLIVQVDGPITGSAYKRGEGLISGSLRYFFN